MKKLFLFSAMSACLLTASVYAQEGKAIYDKACHICHASGVAGAPKSHDAAAWQPRLAQGMDVLVAVVKKGKGAMPPGGMCNDCSDDDYKKAIEYMSK